MSKCSRELDPIFEQITENAVLRNRAEEGTPEWTEREEKSKKLYDQARSIFNRYNPGFKPGQENINIGYFMKAEEH